MRCLRLLPVSILPKFQCDIIGQSWLHLMVSRSLGLLDLATVAAQTTEIACILHPRNLHPVAFSSFLPFIKYRTFSFLILIFMIHDVALQFQMSYFRTIIFYHPYFHPFLCLNFSKSLPFKEHCNVICLEFYIYSYFL